VVDLFVSVGLQVNYQAAAELGLASAGKSSDYGRFFSSQKALS